MSDQISKLTVGLHVKLNYGRLILWAVDKETGQEIGKVETFPAGVDWYVIAYTYLREKYHLSTSRSIIEDKFFVYTGISRIDEYIHTTVNIIGRNLTTGLPAKIDIRYEDIFQLFEPLIDNLYDGMAQGIFRLFIENWRENMQLLAQTTIEHTLREKGVLVETIILESGDFPKLKGFDRWLENVFDTKVILNG